MGIVRELLTRLGPFWRDTRGATAMYVAFAGTLALGGGALSLDIGRLVVLKAQMQNAADSAALSGATQLDGRPGALDRATALAQDAIRHSSRLADGGGDLTIASIAFYSDFAAGTTTMDDDKATVVQVVLVPQNISMVLQPLFERISNSAGGVSSVTLNAQAAAERSPVVCEAPPLMICNPGESSAGDDLLNESNAGRQLLVKAGGGGSISAGNFGLLCPSSGNCGASDVAAAMADNPGSCYGSRVETSPGAQTGPARNGGNARFGTGSLSGSYPAAPNIMSYARDSDLAADTSIKLGNGVWDPSDYWATRHAGEAEPADLADYTRYQMYLYELGETFYRNGGRTIYPTDGISLPSGYTEVSGAGPLPAAGSPPGGSTSDPLRRVLKAAVLDCSALGVQGAGTYSTFGRYVEVFLTEAVSSPPDADIYGELVGPLVQEYSGDYPLNVQLID
jgi:hypothetical protein